jgi:hypothetical protein
MKAPAKSSGQHHNIARSLSAALEPLIDVCLAIGITSPEIESLLRMAFVNRAFEKLPRHTRTGRGPSDSRVALASGVHRAEVGRIRAAGSGANVRERLETKERLYSKSARVLAGWTTDPKFLTSGGLPMDLPMERNRQRRGFEDLVDKYAPGNHPGTVLKELRRRGNVEVQEGEVVRFKGLKTRASGATETNVAVAATRIKHLGETLMQNILDAQSQRLFVETKPIRLNAKQIALLAPILERRAQSFISALDSELLARADTALTDKPRRMGISVFAWDEE